MHRAEWQVEVEASKMMMVMMMGNTLHTGGDTLLNAIKRKLCKSRIKALMKIAENTKLTSLVKSQKVLGH